MQDDAGAISGPILIVGAGHAGVQLASALREEGFEDRIVLICDEPYSPYQRPPLSKGYLNGLASFNSLALRGPRYYEMKEIAPLLGECVVGIDRDRKQIRCASGRSLEYGHLILATGSRARKAPFPGTDLAGVVTLLCLDDAERLKNSLLPAKNVVVIGAGFIGLEFAATAVASGKSVTIIESMPRVMGRAVTEITSEFFARSHRALGSTLLTAVGVEAIEGSQGKVTTVRLTDGSYLPADVVLLAIGVVAEDQLARDCGLACENGIVVDDQMRTSDPHISAIGDCSFHPNIWNGGMTRLESVQNATDQARVVAKRLTGNDCHYDALPWFWSDQGDLKLQIVGLLRDAETLIVRGDPSSRSFSVFAYNEGSLRAVESINRSGDHMPARRIIAEHIPLTALEAGDTAFDLKARAMRRA
jgi:3-phenylpropionate/trans-cinnamate dioxygenase ferredoxin reductase component